ALQAPDPRRLLGQAGFADRLIPPSLRKEALVWSSGKGDSDMGLTDIATIGSIISSVAVALSLVYLALQVRQAERNQRGQMQQGRADRLCGNLIQLSEPATAALWVKGSHAPETLTPEERERFLILCRVAFTSGEDSFLQHRAGLFDQVA